MTDAQPTSIAGIWNLTIKTPIGRQQVELELIDDAGALRGVARGAQETVDLVDPVLEGGTLTWRQSITKPMRLHLRFELAVTGDTMTGTAKAGRLPSSTVTATRAG